jgi:hypothetical protein
MYSPLITTYYRSSNVYFIERHNKGEYATGPSQVLQFGQELAVICPQK